MKEFKCIKDYIYYNDIKSGELKFASKGDTVILMPDNTTVVNISSKPQKVLYNKNNILKNNNFFILSREINKTSTKEDLVNHPKHYTQHPSGVECIDITRHYCFSIGNAIKYLWRAGLKQDSDLTSREKEIEDLKKAIWYINDRIKQLKDGEVSSIRLC